MVCKQIADLKCKQTAENEGIQGDIGYLSLTWISLKKVKYWWNLKKKSAEIKSKQTADSDVNKQLI